MQKVGGLLRGGSGRHDAGRSTAGTGHTSGGGIGSKLRRFLR